MDKPTRWFLIVDFLKDLMSSGFRVFIIIALIYGSLIGLEILDKKDREREYYKETGIKKIVFVLDQANDKERELFKLMTTHVEDTLTENAGISLLSFTRQMKYSIENPEIKNEADEFFLVAYKDYGTDNRVHYRKDDAERDQLTFYIYYAMHFASIEKKGYTLYPIFEFVIDYRYNEERERYEYEILKADWDTSVPTTGEGQQYGGFTLLR